MTTLYKQVTEWMERQKNKHGLAETWVEDTVNEMSNHELLLAISEALEELKTTNQ